MPNHPAYPRHVHAIKPLDRGEFEGLPASRFADDEAGTGGNPDPGTIEDYLRAEHPWPRTIRWSLEAITLVMLLIVLTVIVIGVAEGPAG
jgi:hypothetical protein